MEEEIYWPVQDPERELLREWARMIGERERERHRAGAWDASTEWSKGAPGTGSGEPDRDRAGDWDAAPGWANGAPGTG